MQTDVPARRDRMLKLFWLSATYVLIFPVVFAIVFPENTKVAWIAVTSGAFVMLASRLDEIAEISLGPVRAKMKEKIKEAAATIEQLRRIACAIAKASLTDSMAGNFAAGTSLKTRLQLRDQIIDSLKAVNVSEAELKDVSEEWDRGVGVTFHRGFSNLIVGRTAEGRRTKTDKRTGEAERDFQALLDYKNWRAPSATNVRLFMVEHQIMTPEIEELIKDYEHYESTGQLRRREVFEKL